jgi:streptogramin lyase
MSPRHFRIIALRRLTVVLISLSLADHLAAQLDPMPWPVSSVGSINSGDIAVGSDGNLWFSETGTSRIGQITTSGVVKEFTIPGALALGRVIAPGPDGKPWIVGSGMDGRVRVWAVDRLGLADEIAVLGENPPLGPGFLPGGITLGPDGNVWISNLGEIVRVSPAGQVTRFPLDASTVANSITVGPDANLWFVVSIGPFVRRRQGLCRMTTGGVIDLVLLDENSQGISAPLSIISGPDGNLWFGDNGYSEIVRVTPDPPTKTVFPFLGPTELASGPDGNIWITALGRRTIARLTPAGALTEFELPNPQSDPSGIVAGPDGNLWFTEPARGAIGRIAPDGLITEFAIGPATRIPIHSPKAPRVVADR